MLTERGDLHTLTGAYALDALDDEERDLFEAHLRACDPCAREVADLQAVSRHLSDASEQSPPAGLRDRILLAASTTPQPDTAGPARVIELDERRRSAPRWALRLTTAAAAVLAVAVVGLSYAVADLAGDLAEVQRAGERTERTAEQLGDLLAAPDAEMSAAEGTGGAIGRVVASAQRSEAVFVADGLPEAPPGRVYQLWLIDETGPQSAGLLDPTVDGRVVHLLAGDFGAVVVGVTLEPDGGSTQPTTEPVLAIEVVS